MTHTPKPTHTRNTQHTTHNTHTTPHHTTPHHTTTTPHHTTPPPPPWPFWLKLSPELPGGSLGRCFDRQSQGWRCFQARSIRYFVLLLMVWYLSVVLEPPLALWIEEVTEFVVSALTEFSVGTFLAPLLSVHVQGVPCCAMLWVCRAVTAALQHLSHGRRLVYCEIRDFEGY